MRRHIKDFLRSIFDKSKKEIDNNAVDNTSHDNPINKELVDVDMGAWHKCTNAFKSVNMQKLSLLQLVLQMRGKSKSILATMQIYWTQISTLKNMR